MALGMMKAVGAFKKILDATGLTKAAGSMVRGGWDIAKPIIGDIGKSALDLIGMNTKTIGQNIGELVLDGADQNISNVRDYYFRGGNAIKRDNNMSGVMMSGAQNAAKQTAKRKAPPNPIFNKYIARTGKKKPPYAQYMTPVQEQVMTEYQRKGYEAE